MTLGLGYNVWTLVFVRNDEELLLSYSGIAHKGPEDVTALGNNLLDSGTEKTNVDFSVNDLIEIKGEEYRVNSLNINLNDYGLHICIKLNET